MVLRGYKEVLAALRDPVLSGRCGHFVDSTELLVWPPRMEDYAEALMVALPPDRAVDLIAEFAQPWSNALAVAITGPTGDLAKLLRCAEAVFASGDADATLELSRVFAGECVALKVQAFVALTQTLPAFLGNAWLALLQHPAELAWLRSSPDSMPAAMEELLRFAGPSREVYRAGVVLRLAEANRDETKFPEAGRLHLRRPPARHLAFGAGPHACAGAALIRKAACVATALFVQRFDGARVAGPLEYREVNAICSLQALWALPMSLPPPRRHSTRA